MRIHFLIPQDYKAMRLQSGRGKPDPSRCSFLVKRRPEGNSASEYQLLHFWEKSDRREFRSVTGGVLHSSSGAKNNIIQFQFQKLGPQTYKIVLPMIAPGEYGFLAPGMATSANMASAGKVYTFRIIE